MCNSGCVYGCGKYICISGRKLWFRFWLFCYLSCVIFICGDGFLEFWCFLVLGVDSRGGFMWFGGRGWVVVE